MAESHEQTTRRLGRARRAAGRGRGRLSQGQEVEEKLAAAVVVRQKQEQRRVRRRRRDQQQQKVNVGVAGGAVRMGRGAATAVYVGDASGASGGARGGPRTKIDPSEVVLTAALNARLALTCDFSSVA